jgi:GTP-binding protein Era
VLVNKVDTVSEAGALEALEAWQAEFPDAKVVPISALHGLHIDELRRYLIERLPEHPPYFDKEDMSDRDMRFFVSEIVREKMLSFYQKEIPYSAQVVVNSYEEGDTLHRIQADIVVIRDSQKGIIIGHGGKALRKLGTEARKAIERFVGTKVFLDLRVKVDPDWREDDRKLRKYGY